MLNKAAPVDAPADQAQQNKIKELQDTIDKLKKDVTENKDTIEQLNKAKEQWTQQEGLDKKLKDAESKATDDKDKIKRLEGEIVGLEDANRQLYAQIRRLKDTNKQLDARLNDFIKNPTIDLWKKLFNNEPDSKNGLSTLIVSAIQKLYLDAYTIDQNYNWIQGSDGRKRKAGAISELANANITESSFSKLLQGHTVIIVDMDDNKAGLKLNLNPPDWIDAQQ